MNRDVWPRILREVTYGLTSYTPPPLDQIDSTFGSVIDRPTNTRTRSEYLVAIRAGLASDVDIAAELDLVHSDSAVREFLAAIEKRLRRELQE